MKHFNYILLLLSIIFLFSCGKDDFTYTENSIGIEYSVNDLKKCITFFDDNTIRVSVTKEHSDFIDSSLVVNIQPGSVQFEIRNQKLGDKSEENYKYPTVYNSERRVKFIQTCEGSDRKNSNYVRL